MNGIHARGGVNPLLQSLALRTSLRLQGVQFFGQESDLLFQFLEFSGELRKAPDLNLLLEKSRFRFRRRTDDDALWANVTGDSGLGKHQGIVPDCQVVRKPGLAAYHG